MGSHRPVLVGLALTGLTAAGLTRPAAAVTPPVTAATVTTNAPLNLSKALGNQFEPSVAIDPTNPQRMFELGRDEAGNLISGRSSDGGLTWIAAKVGTTIANAGLPPGWGNTSAVFDRFGNLFVAYLGSGKTTYTDFAMSIDGGASFTNALALAKLTDQPVLATGGGAVWITYNQGGVNLVQGAPVTGLGLLGAFSTAEAVPLPIGQSFGDIAVGPAGQVVVAFGSNGAATGATGLITVSVDPDGLGPAGFGPPVTASTTSVGGFTYLPATPNWGVDAEAHLAWDNSGGAHDGRLYVSYLDSPVADPLNTDLYVRSSDDGGSSWSAPVRVSDDIGAASHLMPALALDQTTGALASTWFDTRHDPTGTAVEYFGSISTDGGLTWGANFALSQGSSNSSLATPPYPIRDTDFGDYTANAFNAGVLLAAWPDNSNSTGDNPAGAGASLDVYLGVAHVAVPPAYRLVVTAPARITRGDDLHVTVRLTDAVGAPVPIPSTTIVTARLDSGAVVTLRYRAAKGTFTGQIKVPRAMPVGPQVLTVVASAGATTLATATTTIIVR